MNKIISNDLNLILLKLDLFTGMLENNFELTGTKSAKNTDELVYNISILCYNKMFI